MHFCEYVYYIIKQNLKTKSPKQTGITNFSENVQPKKRVSWKCFCFYSIIISFIDKKKKKHLFLLFFHHFQSGYSP